MPIIGVTNPADGDDFDKQAFISQMSTPISHVLDDAGDFWVDFGVFSQPTMVFVSADGSTDVHTGALGPQELLDRLKTLADT